MSKRTETLIWLLYAFTCGLLLTLQILAIQERHTMAASPPAASSPMTSPLVSPLDTGKRQTTGKFDLHITSGGTTQQTKTFSQPTTTPAPTVTPSPILPETGGDLTDATK